jgi:type IV pilus assembly protein PilE
MVKKYWYNQNGFSLTEILVVIVIIGILVLLAMPRFTAVITRAKTTEAKTMLKHLHTLEEAYYYENNLYTADLSCLGFEPAVLITDGGEARYQIEIISADVTGYLARATAVIDFDKDGQFNTWEVDQSGKVRQTIPD